MITSLFRGSARAFRNSLREIGPKLAFLLASCAAPVVPVFAQTVTVDFNGLDTAGAPGGYLNGAVVADYLAGFGITTDASPSVFNTGVFRYYASPTTNVFNAANVSGTVGEDTLTFAQHVSNVSFVRVGFLGAFSSSGNTRGGWTATAYDSAGQSLSQVGEGPIVSFGDLAPTTFTLSATNISRVTFIGDNQGRYGTTTPPITDLEFTNQGCQVTVQPQWNQGDPPWGDETYDNYNDLAPPNSCSVGDDTTNCSIRRLGCAVTSLAMALHYAGATATPDGVPLDPGSLDLWMDFQNDYNPTHDVKFHKTVADFSPVLPAQGGRNTFFDSFTFDPLSNDDLERSVCQGNKGKPVPVIVKVPGGTPDTNPGCALDADHSHYVVVTGVIHGANGRHFSIVDPDHRTVPNCFGKVRPSTLDDYADDSETRGFIFDPPGDISRLIVAVAGSAEALITDPFGKRLGYDPTTQNDLKEIQNSNYFRDAISDDITGQLPPAGSVTHSLEMFQPTAGTYGLVVAGMKHGAYTLYVDAFSQDGSLQPEVLVSGVAGISSTSTYQIQYAPSAGSSVSAVRVATFQTIFEDIANSLAIGLIDNSGIANSLAKKIQAAQAAASGRQRQSAINILQAFENEVNAQTGKHITGVAPQVLLQDAAFLILQNQ